MGSTAHKQPLESLPLKQICQQMFNRKWSELFSLHTHDFSEMEEGGSRYLFYDLPLTSLMTHIWFQ